MKVGMISDLHIDINIDYDVLNSLKSQIKNQKIDVLLVAGDISNNAENTIAFMNELNNNTNTLSYFVPGNHDMWDIGGIYEKCETRKVYELYCKSQYCVCDKTVSLNDDWIVIGDLGWYDYTFGSSKFSFDEFEEMSYMGRTWNDHDNTNWGIANIELQKEMLNRLEKFLVMNHGKKIIMMTHMLTHDYFTVHREDEWQYFNAFLGSRSYSDLCQKYNVQYSLMGHIHYRKVLNDNGTRYVCACLNYHNEWKNDELDEQIKSALYVIEII